MRVIDGVADLTDVVEGQRKIERALAADDDLEVFAGHELHHDEEDVVLLLRRENGDDVRVTEAGEEARLSQKLAEVHALLMGNLERNLLVDPGVFGEEDRSKSTAADRRENLVLTDDLAPEEHPAGA